jgi:probable HAF family extracellular repeat protein
MISATSTTLRRRGLAATAAAVLAAVAVVASAPADAETTPLAPTETAGPSDLLGADLNSEANRRGQAPSPYGGFIYHKGKYSPLDGVPGAPLTAHVGINNRGQTAGAYLVDGPTTRGFLRNRSGDYTSFDAAAGAPDVLTQAYKLNDRGTIVGTYAVGSIDDPESAEFHGFLRNPNGAVTTVDVPGASATYAGGINDRGAVVGSYADSDGKGHGFLLDRGMVTPIDPPDADEDAPVGQTLAFDINDRNRIVGVYPDSQGTYHGFLYHKGRFTKLDPPGATDAPGLAETAAFGINNRGQVVGQYVDAAGVLHGYLWQRKRGFKTIDPPRGAGTVAADINDRGEILLPPPGSFIKAGGPGN